MNSRALLLIWIVAILPLSAGRYKLNVDPETKEGFVLQQIKQERNAAKKVELMVQFVDEFPKDENVGWVLEQLIPVHIESKSWDKVLAAGDRLLKIDPTDHETAFSCLRAAEAINTPDILRKYAGVAWNSADLVTESPKPKDSTEVANWQRNAEQARNLKLYAEYAVFALSKNNPAQKEEYLQSLEQLNPRSVYLIAARQAEQKANMTIPAILDGLTKEPHNPDYLAILADHFMRQNDLAKAVQYSGLLIDAFDGNFKPDNMAIKEWQAKKDRYIGQALWMNGIVSSVIGNYHQADRSLRAAIPYMRANPNLLSAGLYHLGYVNYKLAEKGEPNRVFEALKFNQECASIRGTYQDQAMKNIAAIKSEYNLQ
jgi:hypothetical protein